MNSKFLLSIRTISYKILPLILIFSFLLADLAFGQSGRIEGTVRDAQDEERLFGVNVYVQEAETGTTTDEDGYYSIINIPPGEYTLEVTYVGYAEVTVQNVEVNIDQTTTIDIEMEEEALAGEEVTVVAERPVVERDVAASTRNIGRQDFDDLPAADIGTVVGLQAGIQGMNIRGGSPDEVSFQLDGLSLRDERDNTPFTGISYTAVQEIQVQTGGFQAEYGDLRSGLINLVTRTGDRDRYEGDAIFRYRPPGQKHFGPAHNDPESYFMRPFLDDDVAWDGTDSGAWDRYTRDKYRSFEGWNSVAESTLEDGDPTTDLTPQAAQDLFRWQKRKDIGITEPDYDLDMSLGGPVPGIGDNLGNLRFWASYRRSQNMYTIPLSEDRFQDYTGHLKLTSDVVEGAGMTLSIEGMYARQTGTNSNNTGEPGIFTSASGIASVIDSHSYGDCVMFCEDYFAPTQVDRYMLGGTFTHTLTSDTYYEVSVSGFTSEYDTNPGELRDTTGIEQFGNAYMADEAPFGFWPEPADGIGDGMRMGVGMSNSRDSSRVSYIDASFDITSQLTPFLQVKSGVQMVRTNSQVNYAQVDEYLPAGRTQSQWDETPIRGAVYGQATLEFEDIVADLGLRMDYSHANTDWYDYEDFSEAFGAGRDLDEELDRVDTEHQFNLSPRLGVSFPITVDSKLYFNYGHFRSMPEPENLYLVERAIADQSVDHVANPNLPLPKTVSYELGYEHSLFDTYLIRVSGYYRDVENQPTTVTYQDMTGAIEYTVSRPWNYEDTRGAEFTLEKRAGRFVQGFINYTYMLDSSGNFGFANQYENPALQREYERDAFAEAERSRPVPRPYARASIRFLTPHDFGPSVGDFNPLSNWTISWLATWQAGRYFTWVGGGAAPPGIDNNVQWRDQYNVDLRIGKDIEFESASIELFADISNVFNFRHMSQWASYGFRDGSDYDRYMNSLHLPDSDDYPNIPGDDQPGDFRDPDADFHPIEQVSSFDALPDDPSREDRRAFHYSRETGEYYEFSEEQNAWVDADDDELQQVLDDQAYINMPNFESMTFMNPRSIYWGIRVNF